MDNLELISFQIISNVGEAKSSLFEVLELSREEKFEEAEDKIREAEESILKAHESHFSLIKEEASGNKVSISMLLMHAEDQLMNVEMLKTFANEMILTHKKYSNK